MQTVAIRCSICRMEVLTQFPSCLDHKDMDKIEKNWACNNCIKYGRSLREDV